MFYKRDKIFSKSQVTSAPLLPLYCFMISRMGHKQGSYLCLFSQEYPSHGGGVPAVKMVFDGHVRMCMEQELDGGKTLPCHALLGALRRFYLYPPHPVFMLLQVNVENRLLKDGI